MSEDRFEADWLSLRAPFDAAARDENLARSFAQLLPEAAALIDLGCGHGANLRHLLPQLGATQRWTLVDYDAALLDAAPAVCAAWAEGQGGTVERGADGFALTCHGKRAEVRPWQADLAQKLSDLPWAEQNAVTATALFDLTSSAWLSQLVERMAAHRLPGLFTLTYSGIMSWRPRHDSDSFIVQSFNRHQQSDKGFGLALGAQAGERAVDALREAGYRVDVAASDWQIGPADRAMHAALIDGIAGAADMIEPNAKTMIHQWRRARLGHAEAGELHARVSHLDLLAVPQ